jgi:spore coat polysaccharide biosynthesis protein SpsF
MKSYNVAIVQARMGSSRFPGKMLEHLGGMPLIEWVLRRLSKSRALDQIVLATSEKEKDDALVELALTLGVAIYRGSESDVLTRFIEAATSVDATNVVRVCADNPFIDPYEVDRLIDYFTHNQCDYACNHQDRLGSKYADGFGAEIFSAATLKSIGEATKEPRHREHATLYFWENVGIFDLRSIQAPDELAFPELRFDIDSPQDLHRMERYVDLGVKIDSTAVEIIRVASAKT